MNHTKSDALFYEASKYIPGGVNSPVRCFSSVSCNPLFIDHAQGSHIVDVDGNTYLDYIGSWGPMILGHAHPLLCEHTQVSIQNSISYGLCNAHEVELAKLICEGYKGVDMVRMVTSGSEATMSAIRVARAYTKRSNIIKFEGCYHGHSDGLLVESGSGALTFGTPTSPGVLEDVIKHTLVCRYNDIDSLQCMIEANQGSIAAVIIEPIAGNMGVIPSQKEFLVRLRTLCDEYQIILIFDEVISGFRIGFGGASAYYGVTPDMACFGKIIGAGMSVGAYGGRRDLMNLVSPLGPVYQAGTLSGNPFAMQLGVRLLTHLKQHPSIYEELEQKGRYVKEGLYEILRDLELPYQIHQCGSLCTLFFHDVLPVSYDDVKHCDQKAFTTFFTSLLEDHILIAPSPYEAMFLSNAHTYEELDETLVAMKHALTKVKADVLSR